MREKVYLVKQTMTDLVYAQLKKDILDLVYAPEEKLSEIMIAERYGVSRDPVRKALAKLEHEALVSIMPQVGTIVNGISIKQGLEVCDIRLLLETYAVEIAAKTISDEAIRELKEEYIALVDKLKHYEREQAFPLIFQMDKDLHEAIYDFCGNETLKTTILSYSSVIQRIRKANVTWAKRDHATVDEMGAIIDALSNHDPLAAKEAMVVHIMNIRSTVESFDQKKIKEATI